MGVGEQVPDADAIGFVFDVGGLGLIVLVVNHLDVGEGFGSTTNKERPTAEQVTGGSMFFGVGVSDWEIATPHQPSDFFAIDGVGLGFSTVDSLHVQGVTEDEGDFFLAHQVSQPVPVERRFAAHDEIFAERLNFREKGLGVLALEVFVEAFFAVLIDDADVKGLCM